MRTVSFTGVGVTLSKDITANGIMGTIQCYYPSCHDEIFEMMEIYLNWKLHQFSDGKRRAAKLQG